MHRQVGTMHMPQWHDLHFPYTINSAPKSCHGYEPLSPMEIMACGIVTCSSGIHQDSKTSIMNPIIQVRAHVELQENEEIPLISGAHRTVFCIMTVNILHQINE